MIIDKKQCNEWIGHNIRQDTYLFISRMLNGEKYEDIYKDLEENKEKYGIKKEIPLAKESTCSMYVKEIKEKLGLEVEEISTDVPDWYNKTGIYGIYSDDILIYIGKTSVSFKKRFQQHKNTYKNDDSYLHSLMHSLKERGQRITMSPLIIVEDLQIANGVKIKERDLNSMELALITIYQPVGNVEGRLKPYKYRN